MQLHLAQLNSPTTMVSLAIKATDASGQLSPHSIFSFDSGPFEPIGVTFPVGTRGLSAYQASAYSRPSCPLAIGIANLNLVSDEIFDLQVPMAADPLCAPTAQLSLIAGGLGGAGNVDGIGFAARFNSPNGVAVDGAGNLYVADQNNSTIRKVVLATGAVTTLAGTAGTCGSTDGRGSAARFCYPRGVAMDGTGNLYVADQSNSAIRKVALSSGEVTTLAGGSYGSTDGIGTAARFTSPNGVALDGAGNLYVADENSRTIRKVVLASGEVTTLAGTAGMYGSTDGTGSAARFGFLSGLAMDGIGNLYVADQFNSTIRKVVVATGVVTTLAGTARMEDSTDGTGSAARFAEPSGVAIDSAGNLLYVADQYNNTIRKVEVATGKVTTLAGTARMRGSIDGTGSAARFNSPSGVALDGAGNLYIADQDNSTIRKVVLATGIVTTLTGTADMVGSADGTSPVTRFNSPSGMALDGAGNLFIADQINSTIRKVVLATGVATTLAGTAGMIGSSDGTGSAARFYSPTGVAVDGVGNLYVIANRTIRKVVVSTGEVTTLAGIEGMFYDPSGVAVDGAGNLYVADRFYSTISKVVVATGAVTTLAGAEGMRDHADGTGPAARFNSPSGVAMDSGGNLYVADQGNRTIRKVMLATGEVTTLAGTASMIGSADGTGSAARFNSPSGVAVDNVGNLYIADPGNGTIRKLQLFTGRVTTVIGVAGQRRVQLGILPAVLNQPQAVAVLPSGELIILDENSVLRAH